MKEVSLFFPHKGFSLVEVLIALAIVSFALIAIIGLFPVALKSSLDSQRETRAAFIAQQILSDLQSGPGTGTFLVKGKSPTNSSHLVPIDLRTESTNYLAFDSAGFGITDDLDRTNFSSGLSGTAQFVSRIYITTNSQMEGLSKIEIQVETPAFAAHSNRSQFTFVTIMRQEE